MNNKILHFFSTATCRGSQITLYPNNASYCQSTGLPTVNASSSELHIILQVFFMVLGAVAVLFVVIGGLKYTISGGNPEEMGKAKNTIIYAVIGLVIAISAEAIVTFLLGYI